MSSSSRVLEKKIPFDVMRNSSKTLVDQVYEGLRSAILSGRYKPGTTLPPMRVLTERFGISRIVTNAVLARLREEGLINPRPRVGSVVVDHRSRLWKGCVLFITADGDDCYYQQMMAGRIRDALFLANYDFRQCTIPASANGRYQLDRLDIVLSRCVDFAIVWPPRPGIERYLLRRGIPHVAISNSWSRNGTRGRNVILQDWNAANADFASDACAHGVKSVVQVSWDDCMANAVPVLRAHGISASDLRLGVDGTRIRLLEVKRSAYRTFREKLLKDRLPDLFFFADDHIAEGALLAMAEVGIRIPEDVSVVSWANVGYGPLFGGDLTRMECDPLEHGSRIAAWVEGVMAGSPLPEGMSIGPVYVKGNTIRERKMR